MALMDEFKEEREQIKNGTWKQKVAYFWEYYKWYVIVPVIVIGFIGTTIYQKVTAPETILNGVLLNAYSSEADSACQDMIGDFSEELKIDTEEYAVTLNTTMSYVANDTSGTANYESVQALMAWIAAGSVDFICSDHESMTDLAYNGYFVDLRDFLSEEQIEKYEPYFLYIDSTVSKELDAAFDNDVDSASISIPDCTKPETMEDPIPVMIDFSNNAKLAEIYTASDTLALGIAANAPNEDMILNFLNYIME